MGRTITALTVQQRNPQRVNVFLDGEFAFGLERITAAWLRVGQELSEAKILELQTQDTGEVAYRRAIRLLDRRPRTEAEIRRRLETADFPAEQIAAVIARLRQNGLVDDARFAQAWVENRSEFRPRGRRALAQELRQKGLAANEVAAALENVDEDALAYQAALRYGRKLMAADRVEFRRKLSAYLGRRGFGYDVVEPVVGRIWEEMHTPPAENET